MMSAEINNPGSENRPAEACWNRIGVQGDRSCPRLAEAGQCGNCPVFSEAGQRLFDREAPPEYLDEWTRQLAAADSTTVADCRLTAPVSHRPRMARHRGLLRGRSNSAAADSSRSAPHQWVSLGTCQHPRGTPVVRVVGEGARHRAFAAHRDAGRRFIGPVAAADDRRGARAAALGIPGRRGGRGSPNTCRRNGKPALYRRTQLALLLPGAVLPRRGPRKSECCRPPDCSRRWREPFDEPARRRRYADRLVSGRSSRELPGPHRGARRARAGRGKPEASRGNDARGPFHQRRRPRGQSATRRRDRPLHGRLFRPGTEVRAPVDRRHRGSPSGVRRPAASDRTVRRSRDSPPGWPTTRPRCRPRCGACKRHGRAWAIAAGRAGRGNTAER